MRNHPFAVEAFFERSLVLTFAAPRDQLQTLIPECLELDTFQDKWAFIAVAMVQTKQLRPKGFAKMLGNDFFLIGYRVFVKFTDKTGRRFRGLYILKSETDKRKMEFWGNMFTHYHYRTTDVDLSTHQGKIQVTSMKSGFAVTVDSKNEDNVPLPVLSPFAEWKDARRFAGPLPFTFTYDPANKEVLVIEGVRENWRPAAVRVIDCHFPFLESLQLNDLRLASAFAIHNIPYHWKKGRIEKWKPNEENFRAY